MYFLKECQIDRGGHTIARWRVSGGRDQFKGSEASASEAESSLKDSS